MSDPHEIPVGLSVAMRSGELTVKRETDTTWLVSRKHRDAFRTVARIQQISEGWLADPVYGDAKTDVQGTWDEALQLSTMFPVDVSPARKTVLALLGAGMGIALVSFIVPAFTGGRVTTVMWVLVATSFLLVAAAGVIMLVERHQHRSRRVVPNSALD